MNRTENRQIQVLLVEDNPGDVRLIRELLKEAVSAEFNITPAGDLGETLERLSEGKFDVILLEQIRAGISIPANYVAKLSVGNFDTISM